MSTITRDPGRVAATPARLDGRMHITSQEAGVASTPRSDAGLAVLRAIVGTVFVAHGAQKLFVFGLPGLTAGFESMGIPLAAVAAPAVALVELLGGLALIAGLLTRLASVGLAITMLGAIVFAHLSAGFFAPDGVEFVLTLFGAAVALALTGPGALSLDARLARHRA